MSKETYTRAQISELKEKLSKLSYKNIFLEIDGEGVLTDELAAKYLEYTPLHLGNALEDFEEANYCDNLIFWGKNGIKEE